MSPSNTQWRHEGWTVLSDEWLISNSLESFWHISCSGVESWIWMHFVWTSVWLTVWTPDFSFDQCWLAIEKKTVISLTCKKHHHFWSISGSILHWIRDTPSPPPRPAPPLWARASALTCCFISHLSLTGAAREEPRDAFLFEFWLIQGQLLLSELNLEDPRPDQNQEEEDVPGGGARGRRLRVFGRDEVHVGHQRPQTAAGNTDQ